jgi:hypothetical protein
LSGLAEAARTATRRGPPPVERWNPPFCGDIDMVIRADGSWFYMGTPIGRPALVRLFSTVLRKDPDRYVLVTPVERVGIRVEDAPFIAVEMREEAADGDRRLVLRTNVDDETVAGPDHPLRFERDPTGGLKPYVHVRGGLWARLARPVMYDLVALGEEREHEGETWFGIVSAGAFFPIVRAQEIEGLT